MKHTTYFLIFAISLIVGGMARAQTTAWVQIEAQPSLSEAEKSARAYTGAFDNVAGFAMTSGWYAIALGPYSAPEAQAELARLLSERLVPADSFIAFSTSYRQKFWPVGFDAAATEAPSQPETDATEAPAVRSEPQESLIAEETPAEARQSEALLSREERMELQVAMQWYGHYNSAIDGAFGPGTRNAMASWQAANGLETTGILTTTQRATLLNLYHDAQAALGLTLVRDEEAGIEIEMPMAMLEFDSYAPPFAHYAEKNASGLQAFLISQKGSETTLFGLYDLLQTLEIIPLEGARERGPRDFTINGRSADRAAFVTAKLVDGAVKGYGLIWNPADDERMARVLAVMEATFSSTGQTALDPGMKLLSEAQRAGMVGGLEVRRPAWSRSGFYVDATGTVVTSAGDLNQCRQITLSGDHDADLASSDAVTGVAVLRPRETLAPIAFARLLNAAPQLGSDVAVAGFSYGDQLDQPVLTFGALAGLDGLDGETGVRRLSLKALPGDVGGPVYDGSGAVLGMLLPRVEGGNRLLPGDVNLAASAESIVAALAAGGVNVTDADPVGGVMAPEDMAGLAADMTVLVSCWN
ncbi:MAG: serine protease [Paracoccaceae bacterium]